MNSIHIIRPYKMGSLWVFDDNKVGLEQEPFVAGTDAIIDAVTATIPNAASGFVMIFSEVRFPGHQYTLMRDRPDRGGWWYVFTETGDLGWLCPALFKYFPTAPTAIYVAIKEDKPT
jgi:hypothetical protein